MVRDKYVAHHQLLLFFVSAFLFTHMTAPITHFISFEVGDLIGTLFRLSLFAALWPRTLISAMRIVAVIYMPVEIGMPMVPRARADKRALGKPLRAVVSVRRALVRFVVIVTVRALRGASDVDRNLSLGPGSHRREAESRHAKYDK